MHLPIMSRSSVFSPRHASAGEIALRLDDGGDGGLVVTAMEDVLGGEVDVDLGGRIGREDGVGDRLGAGCRSCRKR